LRYMVRSARELRSMALEARASSGKPLRSQLAEVASLRRGKLTAREYYEYQLFDDSRFTPTHKREYVGRRFQWRVYKTVNDPGLVARSGIAGSWGGMVDKGLFDLLIRAAGLPTPRIIAVFDPAGGDHPNAVTVRTLDDLESVLRTQSDGFFSKPARAASGDDAYAVLRIDGDAAHLGNGDRLPMDMLLRAITVRGRTIIQERLAPHPEGVRAFGSTVATTRIVVLRGDASSRIHRVVLRIPVGRSMVDNFGKGHRGNLLASVDTKTGRLRQAWEGVGPAQRRVEHHPDTGHALEGWLVPDWSDALGLIDRASRLLAGMSFQSWDLAPTDRGPVLIEVNDVSSQDVLQLCGPPGMLDRELCAFLRECGFRWRYPYPA
jgi:Sugar-transfer associated ATP-grasp